MLVEKDSEPPCQDLFFLFEGCDTLEFLDDMKGYCGVVELCTSSLVVSDLISGALFIHYIHGVLYFIEYVGFFVPPTRTSSCMAMAYAGQLRVAFCALYIVFSRDRIVSEFLLHQSA